MGGFLPSGVLSLAEPRMLKVESSLLAASVMLGVLMDSTFCNLLSSSADENVTQDLGARMRSSWMMCGGSEGFFVVTIFDVDTFAGSFPQIVWPFLN